jgi:predicted RND superfamily exporter protein
MRNVIIAVLAFIVMVALMFFSINYLNKISSNLQKLNDDLEQYITDDNWDKAYKSSMEFTHRWEKHSKIIKVFVNHQEIDNVEMELWKLPQYVKQHTKDEALASVHVLKFILAHITNLEKVNLQNVF